MSVQKRKPSVSPPNQAAQSQARGSEEFPSFQQNYQSVQPGYPVQTALPHDMSKQSVVAGHLPAAGIPQQTANIYQQTGIIQPQTYFGTNQQGMRPQRSFTNPPMAQPNQPVYHMMYMGQPPAPQYSAGNVMVQQSQMMGYSTGQRLPTPSYSIPSSQPIQQQYQPQYQQQPSQQYPSQAAYSMYYPSQPMPVNQPQRPPANLGPTAAPTNKRERKPIQIVDPNTGREVTEEILHLKSTPPGGSARSTPGSTGVPGSTGSTPPPSMGPSNDVAAQFAAQVAATLRPGSTPGSSGQRQEYGQTESTVLLDQQMQDAGDLPTEFVPAAQQDSIQNSNGNFVPQRLPVLHSGSGSQRPEPDTEQTQEKEISQNSVQDDLSNDHNIVQAEPDSSSPVVETEKVVSASKAVIHHLPTSAEQKTEVTSPVQSETLHDDQVVTERVIDQPCAPVVEANTDLPAQTDSVDLQALSSVSSMDAPRELLQKNQRIDVSEEALVVENKAEVKQDSVVKEVEVPVIAPAEPIAQVVGVLSSSVPEKPSDLATETTVADSNISKDVKSKGKRKLKDINRKGEEKEGTDMDAFLDIQENEVHIPPVETKPDKIEISQVPALESNMVTSSKIVVELSKPVVESSKVTVELSKQVETSKPAVETSKPAVGSSKPVVETSKPAVETTKPAVETSKPTVETSKPDVEVSKPVAEVTKPDAEVAKPVAEVTKPVAEVTKPVAEVTKPVAEVTKPVAEVAKPVAEVTKPVAEVTKPVAEVAKPVAEVAKPVDEVSKPVDELTKPAVDVSKSEVEEKKEDAQTQHAPVQIVITEAASVAKEVEIEIKDATVSKDSDVNRENAKNNVKTNEAQTEKSESATLKYKYKEDQWSPLNPEGKCQYDRSFLLDLQFAKDSMTKPNALPNLPDIILDKPYSKENNSAKNFEPRFNMPDFTPGYARGPKMGGGGGMGGGGPGSMTKRGSQSRMREQRVIKSVSIQREEVKLHKSDSAWKPGHKDEKKGGEDLSKTEELNKKVKSILNKLTPQKFQTLLTQMHGLTIDTEERLKGVTDLIFEKAISEPGFSVAYANMCRFLLMLKVPSETKEGDFVNFRVILLTRCQREFERDKDDQEILDKKRKEVEEASEEKKAQLKEELEFESSRARRRSIGNIRFIGELFKLKMLTENIMHDCVFKLLRSRDEENLECLCRLLTTIGKELESEKAKPRMDQYFSQMQKIVAEKKVSSRCRFMLQDVIDLRTNRWVPRRDENKPKTIDQIHKEAKQEEIQRQMISQINSQQPTKRNRPRGPPQQMGQGGGGMGEDGWNTVSSKAGMRNIDRNIDVSKLRINKSSDDNIQLGPGGGARTFGGWGRGSSGGGSRGSQEGERPNAPGNRYAALSKEEDQRSRAFGRGVSPHRGQGRPPGAFQKPRIGLRGSQELERERAIASARTIVSGRSTPPSAPTSREGSRTREHKQKEVEKAVEAVKQLTEEEMEQKTKAIIDEYLHLQDKKEAVLCVTELQSPGMIHIFVQTAISHVLERSRPARRQTGLLLHDLIKQKIITVETYLKGSNEILQCAEDMEIDIPKIWNYFGELIGPMVQDGSVPLSFLRTACQPLVQSKKAGILVAEILHDASQELGHKVVAELWRSSGLRWTDFVASDEVDQFLKEKNLEFTVGPTSQPSTPTDKVSFDKIHDDLKEQLTKAHCDNESVFDWIEANVSEETTKEPKFIRSLMTAVCSSAISGAGNMAKVDPESIRMRRALLQKYLEHKPLFELQALYALQALVCKLEHPPGVLRTFFDTLYDEEIISEDAFNQWENSNDPGEKDGKGVALKQVVQFFAWLREGEEDENDS